jgi:hypothetical protein
MTAPEASGQIKPADGSPAPRWLGIEPSGWAVITATGLLLGGFAIWAVTPAPPVGFYWDDTFYLLMAEWLSGRPEHRALIVHMLELRQYPPLFPLSLRVIGAGLEQTDVAFIMNALLLALGTIAAMCWLLREAWPKTGVILAAILMMGSPVALDWLASLFSEHQFIFLTYAALLLASIKDKSAGQWLGIGCLIGLAIATRSAGWALAVGMLAHLAWARQFTGMKWTVSGVLVAVLLIPFLKVGLPPAKNYFNGLVDHLTLIDGRYVLAWIQGLGTGWLNLWGSWPGAILAGALVIPGVALRLARNDVDAWYILVSLGMLFVWPFPDHLSRFLWVLMPAFLAAMHTVTSQLPMRAGWPAWIIPALASIVLFSLPNGLLRSLERMTTPPTGEFQALSRMPEWTRAEDRETGEQTLAVRKAMLADVARIKRFTTDATCVYSELPMLVVAGALRPSLASPWNGLEDARPQDMECAYYYLIPLSLPGIQRQDIVNFSAQHEELFRSPWPGTAFPDWPLAVFYRLNPASPNQPLDSPK